jgi:Uma2 family endonuclease
MVRLNLGAMLPRVYLSLSRRAEQIMGMPAETMHRWTAREVRALIDAAPLATPRYELVDGELLVTPGPSMPHQNAVRQLLLALSPYLDRESAGVTVCSPSDVELEAEDLRQPDVYVMTASEWRRVIREGNPVRELLLAIEILSPSSGRHDRVKKRPGYQRHVPEYWIVDLDARLVERWRPGDERPEILTQRLEWQPAGARQSLAIDLPAFFAQARGETGAGVQPR